MHEGNGFGGHFAYGKARALLRHAAQSSSVADQFWVERRGIVGIDRGGGLDSRLGQLAPVGKRLTEFSPCRVIETEHHREMAKNDHHRQIGARDAIPAEVRLAEIVGKIQRFTGPLDADGIEDDAVTPPALIEPGILRFIRRPRGRRTGLPAAQSRQGQPKPQKFPSPQRHLWSPQRMPAAEGCAASNATVQRAGPALKAGFNPAMPRSLPAGAAGSSPRWSRRKA